METLTKHCDVCKKVIDEEHYMAIRTYIARGKYTEEHLCGTCLFKIQKILYSKFNFIN
jgi:hypothetical protein